MRKQIFNFVLYIAVALTICPSFSFAKNSIKSASSKHKKSSIKNNDDAANVNLNFEEADLKTFLFEIQTIFKVSFIYDEDIKSDDNEQPRGYAKKEPTPKLSDVKITFRTNKPFTKKQAWRVVDQFLNIAGLARTEITNGVYRISQTAIASKEALPSYIGTTPSELPDSGLIRYVYFLKNNSAEQIQTTIKGLLSKGAKLSIYKDLKALIFTDQAYNIKSIMKIITELDSACNTVALSVLKLEEADAVEVEDIYNKLKNKRSSSYPTYGAPLAKQENKHFLQEANVFAEPRTNTLIIIGPPDATERIEKFITQHIDTKLAKPRSKIHTVDLNYIPAEQVAKILNEITRFGNETPSSQFGGVRGGEKFFSKMFFEAEKQGNRLIVRGEEEDFNQIKNVITEMDKPQPQVAIEVLIVSLENNKGKGLKTQLNNKNDGKVNFQSSGIGGIKLDDNAAGTSKTLTSNLISLASAASIGSTVISLGSQTIWGLLSIINETTKTNVISNPFLVTTNKYKARTKLGEIRRVSTETIQGSTGTSKDGKGDVSADLEVEITPRINSFGIVNLDIDITIESFTDTDVSSANKSSKTLHTNASLSDGEVLAIGGLTKNTNKSSKTGVPVISKIPILGNLFKSKTQTVIKENLVVFITPKIIKPNDNLHAYTRNKALSATSMMSQMDSNEQRRDPIARWLFTDNSKEETSTIDNFIKDNLPRKSEMRKRERKSITGNIHKKHTKLKKGEK